MAQIDTTLYATIAEAYANIDDNLSNLQSNTRSALDAIVDVSTTTYPDPSANADDALELELALLTPFNTAYVGSANLVNSTSSLLDAIRAINNHVINNISGSDTATVKLQTWINTTMTTDGAEWVGTGCPEGWANLCTDAGYDVSGWNTV